ncbi:MAG TPA: hypothetical protein VHQ90_13680 [Thermoanaerobaculia bacterium]|nr:hypothetical protein [Thermoanaerobaculia bacterium]
MGKVELEDGMAVVLLHPDVSPEQHARLRRLRVSKKRLLAAGRCLMAMTDAWLDADVPEEALDILALAAVGYLALRGHEKVLAYVARARPSRRKRSAGEKPPGLPSASWQGIN